MPGDAFCSPCWIPAVQRPQKRRRKLPRIGQSRGSGLTPLPLVPLSRPPVTSPWRKVGASFSWAMGVRVLLPGFRGPKTQRELRTGPGFQGASRMKVGKTHCFLGYMIPSLRSAALPTLPCPLVSCCDSFPDPGPISSHLNPNDKHTYSTNLYLRTPVHIHAAIHPTRRGLCARTCSSHIYKAWHIHSLDRCCGDHRCARGHGRGRAAVPVI